VRGVSLLSLILGLAPLAHAAPVPSGKLPRTVVPLHYALTLTVDPAQAGFSGEVRIRVRNAETAQTIFLHAKELEIARASATPEGGAEIALHAEPVHESGVLALGAGAPLPAGELELVLSFRARYSTQLDSTYKVVVADRPYVMTQFEPLSARRSFPCFDEPSFKTPWDVTLVVPAAAAAVANARVLREEPLAGGQRRVVFATTEPLPSYLVAYAVGPFDVVEAPPIPPTPERSRPLPLRGLAVHGRGGDLRAALAETPRVVTALERWFGLAYPWEKLDLLAAPDFAFGAMENAGLIVYQDRLLLVDDDSPTALRQAFLDTHIHELAHQWFGNLVTPPWWDDLWLNEAFATWLATKLTAELEPAYQAELHALEGVRWAMALDGLASARRIAEPIADYRDVASAFDGVTYEKGGAVLAMFESYLGAERFRDALRAHVRRFARGNATSADLIDSLAAASDDPAAFRAAFRSFLDQPGTPRLDVALACDGVRPVLRLGQRRDLPLGSTASPAQRWGVPLCVRLGAASGSTKHCALALPETTELPLPAGACPRWVMPNADGAGYYRFTQPPVDRAALDVAFPELSDREQLMVADSVAAAFHAGRLEPAELLHELPRLAASRSWPAASVPLEPLEWLREHLADDTQRGALDALARRAYGPRLAALSLDERAGEPDEAKLERQALVGVLAHAGDAATRAELLQRARAALAAGFGNAELSANQRASALEVLAQDGTDADFAALETALRASEDSQLRRDLVSALGAARSPARGRRARALALDPAVRSGEVLALLGSHFAWRENRAAARAWFRANQDAILAKLPALAATDAPFVYAAGACSEAEAREVEARFAGPMAKLEGGPRALAQLEEGIRLCVALRAQQAQAGFGGALP
jgi:alanyl aminopeptidase